MTQNKLTLALLLLTLTLGLTAQNNTSSPYSRFGIGILESKADVTSAGMGHAGVALSSDGFLNNLNPASYSSLDSTNLIFNIQGRLSFANYETSNDQQRNVDSNYEAISIGFRAGKNWGMGFSLSPYSSIGYSVNTEKYILGTIDKYPVEYNGKGGLNQIAWHNGFRIFKGLSLGVSTSYLWGSSDITEVSYYPSIIGETIYNERNYHFSTLMFDYGFQWHQAIGQNMFSLAATANFSTELNSHYTHRIYNDVTSDLSSSSGDTRNFSIPMGYQFGLAYQTHKGWTIVGDFRYNNWAESDLSISYGSPRDTYGGNLGLQYAPTRYYDSFFKRLHYRIGAFYNQEYYSVLKQDIDSKGITAGLTIPLRGKSRVNLAYEYKHSGTTSNGLINEQFNTIRVGLTFSEKWFQKTQFK
ncbi:hypothetical protein KEM09_09920 [Carboxylicivirga mesophila]|uniref:Outer membrane protein n=1 Tax=Carboxylicivirga mesophila TaxID=1166478 RepID=A0ABS5K9U8_9BACT|nr:hypothetical protein [Carboxylicivirga mesophila]MBS2211721.1 hypothetical protein [Carboxylicivirga mesophila]